MQKLGSVSSNILLDKFLAVASWYQFLTKAFLKDAPCVLCYLGYLAIERKVAGLQKNILSVV